MSHCLIRWTLRWARRVTTERVSAWSAGTCAWGWKGAPRTNMQPPCACGALRLLSTSRPPPLSWRPRQRAWKRSFLLSCSLPLSHGANYRYHGLELLLSSSTCVSALHALYMSNGARLKNAQRCALLSITQGCHDKVHAAWISPQLNAIMCACLQMCRVPEVLPPTPGGARPAPSFAGVAVLPLRRSLYASTLSQLSALSASFGPVTPQQPQVQASRRSRIGTVLSAIP